MTGEHPAARRRSVGRVAIQAPLGFSSGLPILLIGSTLSAWMVTEGVDIKTIGLFALVAVPFNLKFIWAPLLDHLRLPWLDRRRDWMIATQLALIGAIVYLGTIDASANLGALALVALTVALFSASQDIVVDAYRTDILEESERGRGTGAYVAGYRVALIIAGSGALLLADHISFRFIYWILAGLMSVGVVSTLFAPKVVSAEPPANLRAAVVLPFLEFFGRKGALTALAIVGLYKLGDSIAGHMVVPFLLDLDFSKTEIGVVQKAFGMGATILGAGIGGVLSDRLGLYRSLIYFGIAQAAANVGYLALAGFEASVPGLALAVGIDNFCNGLGTAAFVAYLMSLCNAKFSATQYALLTSAMALLGNAAAAPTGYLVESSGWIVFFTLTIVAAVPALLLLVLNAKSIEPRICKTSDRTRRVR